MKGMIFILVESFIKETFGDEIYYEIMDRSKLQTKDPFVYPGTYPDSDLIEMVVKAAEVLKISVDDALMAFGAYFIGAVHPRHPEFFDKFDHPKDFLKTVDGVIHMEVRKLMKDTLLPSFEHHEPNENTLVLSYHSERKLHMLAHGILNGVGEQYKQHPFTIHRSEPYQKDGKEFVDFTLVFES